MVLYAFRCFAHASAKHGGFGAAQASGAAEGVEEEVADVRSPLELITYASPDLSAKRRRSVEASASASAPPMRTDDQWPADAVHER